MTDVHSASIRSKNMRAIKSKGTKPEIVFRKALHRNGLRYRLHVKTLAGSPDIVLPKYKTLVFINGCFWHGHRCRFSKVPKTRPEFWLSKISDNISRDQIAHQKLTSAGWRIAVVWECAIRGKSEAQLNSCIGEFLAWLCEPHSQGIELPSASQSSCSYSKQF